MLVPGSNLLAQALTVIAKQPFNYYANTGRTTSTNGQLVATYAMPVAVQGSWQAVPRSLFYFLGLDLQKNYANVYVPQSILDVSRNKSGDQFEFQGHRYQVESITPWYGIDGWVQCLCVMVS